MTATDLPQTITVWKSAASDGAGGTSWATPIDAPGRAADFVEEVKTAEGKTFISKKVFYTEQNIELGDYIVLGDLTALPNPSPDLL